MAGDYLYVSGQGAAKTDGSFPETTEQQIEQALNNIKAIVEGAGLTMQHIVYAQLYLTTCRNTTKRIERGPRSFPKDPPALATLGIAKLPTDTPVEITVVAVKDLSRKKIVPGGVMVGDRLYLSGSIGRDKTGTVPQDPAQQVQLAFDQMSETLKAAGMDFRNVVFVNPYLTEQMPMNVMNSVYAKHFEFGNTPARATIKVASLPHGATHRVHGRRCSRSFEAAGRTAEEHGPEPNGESMCVRGGYVLLLGEVRIHPRPE